MSKTWRYIHFDPVTKKNVPGEIFKVGEIISDTQPDSDYNEVKSVLDVYNTHYNYFGDYSAWRQKINEDLNDRGWDDLTDQEKDICIELDLYEDGVDPSVFTGTKITYLVGKGENPALVLGESFANHHVKDIENCRLRGDDVHIYIIVGKYLSLQDAADFFRLIQGLYTQYRDQAIKGTLDGFVGIGMFDFIESTPGTIYEFSGLESQGYTINSPHTVSDFITEFMLWFREGKKQ